MPWDPTPPPPREPMVQRGMDMLGRAVKRARHRKGWSQRDLEARTGIDQSTISKFENGQRIGLRFTRFAAMVAVLDGLDFDAPGHPPVEPYLSPRAQRLADEAALEAAIAASHWPSDADVNDEEVDLAQA